MRIVRVQAEPIAIDSELAVLTHMRTDIGAVVSFTGLCRDEAGALAALELEHFPGMAESEIERIVVEAEARWDLTGTIVVHRFGVIKPGETIVLAGAASAHRAAAFAATAFIMDFLKTDAPFWKREHRVDPGREANAAALGQWIGAKESDRNAVDRW